MDILGWTQDEVPNKLGSAVIAPYLLHPTMEFPRNYHTSGYNVRVGFFDGYAKYAVFQKDTLQAMDAEEVMTALGAIGHRPLWVVNRNEYSFDEQDQNGQIYAANAYFMPIKSYLMVHVRGMLIDRDAVNAKMPGGGGIVHPPGPGFTVIDE